MPNSSEVSEGQYGEYTQYNNLRKDALQFFNAGDGSDGTLNVTSGITQIDCDNQNIVIKQYTSFNISAGATVELINVPDDGVIFIIMVQGNCTIAGMLDLEGDGATGGAGVSVNRTSSAGQSNASGTAGTNAFNNFGQTRSGGPGTYFPNGDAQAYASGGGGAAATNTSGIAASSTTGAVAAGGYGGASITLGILALAAQLGITISPGAGGASGGVVCSLRSGTTGTFTATSGNAGRGGGGLLVFCGGNYSMTGTVKLNGTNASTPSVAVGSAGQGGSAAGGSSGGASGCGAAFVKGTVTNSGTYTVTAGTSSNGAYNAAPGGATGQATSGGTSAAGQFLVCRVP